MSSLLHQSATLGNLSLPNRIIMAPLTVANEIERWFTEGAVDGFNIRIGSPSEFARFTNEVLPILRERGLFRTEYQANTLRGHLGLNVPPNRYSETRQAAAPLAQTA